MSEHDPQIGGRIRRLRRQKRMSQARLAELVGISPSYLNLIEHNRRRITVPLLFKAAGVLDVEVGDLAESDDSRLAGDLMELFGDDLFVDCDLTNQDIRDLAVSNPAIGRAVVRLFDGYKALRRTDAGTASESEGQADLVSDRISDFLQENANHFPALETAAERIRYDIDQASDSFDYGLKTYLFNVFGLTWRLAPLPEGMARRIDNARHEIVTADILPTESATFTVAHQLGLLAAGREIDAIVATAMLPPEAAPLARNALASYFAAALIMPYDGFLAACRRMRYDIERIARCYKTSFEQVCHRMTTLQRPGASGIPLHLVRTDIAGNISKRFSLSGIHIPRHTGACPRWNVYSAFLHPEQISVQISQMPEGQRYFCVARTVTKGGFRHNAPRRHLSIGIGCHIAHASELVYSDGMDITNPTQSVPIGVGCRICPRLDCGQRAHPPADHRFVVDETTRAENFYARPRVWGLPT